MTQIQTAPTTLTSLTIEDTGFNIRENRWKIRYFLTRTEMLTTKESREPAQPNTFRTVVLQDTPETPIFDEEGVQTGTTPAGTAYTDWFATWNTHEEMLAASEAAAIAHANIQEWDGTVIDDITNDPNAEDVQPWQPNQLVAPPNRRSYEGKVYGVVQAHTTQAQWTPNLAPALFNFLFDEGDGGGGLLPWVQPTGAQDAYAIGAQVTHNGQCWESTIAANTTTPEETAFNWWIVITCP